MQLDPLTDDYPYYTPYQYAGNEPVANVDLDGLEEAISTTFTGATQAAADAAAAAARLAGSTAPEFIYKLAPKVASTAGTRLLGGLKAVGGLFEAGAGAALGVATSWTGVGAVVGGVVAVHGMDEAAAGFTQLFTGKETKSYTEQGISNGLQATGVSPGKANDIAAGANGAISIIGTGGSGALKQAVYKAATKKAAAVALTKGAAVVEEATVAAEEETNALVKSGTQFSKHSLERLAERGITQDMAELAIRKGQKFYDPLNKSINYVLPKSFASGKNLLVGTNPLTREVTTVIRSSKNLINSRFISIP